MALYLTQKKNKDCSFEKFLALSQPPPLWGNPGPWISRAVMQQLITKHLCLPPRLSQLAAGTFDDLGDGLAAPVDRLEVAFAASTAVSAYAERSEAFIWNDDEWSASTKMYAHDPRWKVRDGDAPIRALSSVGRPERVEQWVMLQRRCQGLDGWRCLGSTSEIPGTLYEIWTPVES